MLEAFYGYILHLFQTIDYWAVFIMMAIEASVIPFPSEIPMLAVGIQSAHGTMNPFIGLCVALAGVFIGTTVNYYIGYFIGDTFIEKYGKYFGIKKSSYHEAQRLFQKDASFYTFFGRLVPVIRQIISIPAGMAHMPYLRFIFLSLSGSAIWLTILIILGYFIGDNTHLIKQYITGITLVILCVGVTYFLVKHKSLLKKVLKRLK